MNFDHEAADKLRALGVNINRLTMINSRTWYEDCWDETVPDCAYILELLTKPEDAMSDLYCDACGRKNPPVTTSGNGRVTLCCIKKGGFYNIPEAPKGYGSNGKTTSHLPLSHSSEIESLKVRIKELEEKEERNRKALVSLAKSPTPNGKYWKDVACNALLPPKPEDD